MGLCTKPTGESWGDNYTSPLHLAANEEGQDKTNGTAVNAEVSALIPDN